MLKEKRPRQYAQEIEDLQTREEKVAALAKVPDDLREMVRTHLNMMVHARTKRDKQ